MRTGSAGLRGTALLTNQQRPSRFQTRGTSREAQPVDASPRWVRSHDRTNRRLADHDVSCGYTRRVAQFHSNPCAMTRPGKMTRARCSRSLTCTEMLRAVILRAPIATMLHRTHRANDVGRVGPLRDNCTRRLACVMRLTPRLAGPKVEAITRRARTLTEVATTVRKGTVQNAVGWLSGRASRRRATPGRSARSVSHGCCTDPRVELGHPADIVGEVPRW